MRAKPVVGVLIVLSLLVGLGGTAYAKKAPRKKVSSIVSIGTITDSEISGLVDSSRNGCEANREVEVTVGGSDAGTTDTDSDGNWTVLAPVDDGDQVVANIDKDRSGRRVTCRGDTDRETANLDGPATNTLTVDVDGLGDVDSSPAGINNCRSNSGSCAANYADNSTVTLTATPDAGQDFAGWGGACSGSGTGQCTVAMSSDRFVTATFVTEGSPAPTCAIPEDIPEPIRGLLCTVLALLGA